MKTTRTVKKSLLLNEVTKSNLSIKDLNNIKGGTFTIVNTPKPTPEPPAPEDDYNTHYETIPPGKD